MAKRPPSKLRIYDLCVSGKILPFDAWEGKPLPVDKDIIRKPVDLWVSWNIPVVQEFSNGNFIVFQHPVVWRRELSVIEPNSMYAWVVSEEEDPLKVNTVKEMLHFLASFDEGLERDALLDHLYNSPTLLNTLSKHFLPDRVSASDKWVLSMLGENKTSKSGIDRAKRRCGKTKALTPQARWNRFAKRCGYDDFEVITAQLEVCGKKFLDRFLERLSDRTKNPKEWAGKTMKFLAEKTSPGGDDHGE